MIKYSTKKKVKFYIFFSYIYSKIKKKPTIKKIIYIKNHENPRNIKNTKISIQYQIKI